MTLEGLLKRLLAALATEEEPRSLLDRLSLTGVMNFRIDRFDCGLGPAGFYEDDL